MKKAGISLVIMLIVSTSAVAQSSDDQEDTSAISKDYREAIDDIFNEETPLEEPVPGNLLLPEGITLDDLDQPTREKYFAALREQFEYRITGFQHRKEVFEWQLYSSKITFVVVIFLVIAGIYFSGVQFHSSLKMKKESEPKAKPDVTKLEASMKGIKVSSPVLGVIILVISLLFFYLYLVHVYPIEEIM